MNIICPVYAPGTYDEDAEKYIIYNVSKEEYETCRITNPNPRIIAICDKPYKLMYFTITFRPFTPQPGGLEFLPGKDYYFICKKIFPRRKPNRQQFLIAATSSKDDLHRRIGGRCSTNNMKIVFKVCCAPNANQYNTTIRPFTTPPTAFNWPIHPTLGPTTTTTEYVARTEVSHSRKPTKKTSKWLLVYCPLHNCKYSVTNRLFLMAKKFRK